MTNDPDEGVTRGARDWPSSLTMANIWDGESIKHSIRIPQRELFRLQNIFKGHEYALPKGYQPPSSMVVVDVGANVGGFALYALDWAEQVRVFSFEPNPLVWGLFQENLANYEERVHLRPFGLGEKDGSVALYHNPFNTGASTLRKDHRKPGSAQDEVVVKASEDALKEEGLSRVDVLKVDTEGYEVPVLRGLGSYLDEISIIMLEYHSEEDRREIDDLLRSFQLYAADIVGNGGIGTVKYINKTFLL